MATIFTRIIDGDLPGTFVWKDEVAVAFLSINPINTGHVLVVPREEVDRWLDLSSHVAQHVMAVSHSIGQAQMQAFQPDRVGLMIAGFEVPHCHVHVIPADDMRHLDFANAASSADPADLERSAQLIRAALRDLGYSQMSE